MADRCKFQKLQYQVSYNNGSTWQDVTPIQVKKGDIIEYMSLDCATIQTLYRWVDLEGTYLCDGDNKYTRQIQEESYDNGVSWYTSYPTVYQQGTFVGVDEEYCCDKFVGHYQFPEGTTHYCPTWYKWDGFQCVYVDPIKVVKCDGTSTLTRSDTLYYDSTYPLVECEIGDSVTSIGDSAFTSCKSLISIEIPDNVTSIGNYAFQNCSGLTSCTIGSGVTSIGNSAFSRCSGLRSVDIPNSVTNIGNSAFTYCTRLTNIVLPTGLTSIGDSTFHSCFNLQSIDIPTSVTSIGAEAFWDCDSLSSVTIPDSVTSIGREAFVGCNALSEVIIGSGITSIGYEVFDHCPSLSSVTVNATTPPTLGTRAFSGTSSSLKIYVPCESVSAYTSANSWSDYKKRIKGIPPCTLPNKFSAEYSDGTSYSIDCSILELTSGDTRPSDYTYSAMTSCTIGECVTSIGNGALQNCYGLTNVEIPDNVSSIGNYAFKNCRSFTSVIIPDSVTNIGQSAFTNCSGLTSITCLAVTPPTLAYSPIGGGFFQYFNFDNTNDCPIYVPCESVNTYRTTSGWGHYASRITCSNGEYRWYPSGTTCIGYDKWEQSIKQISYDGGTTWENASPIEYSATTLIESNSPDCGYVPPTFNGKWKVIDRFGSVTTAACDSTSAITRNETPQSGIISCEIGNCVTTIGNEAFIGYGITSVTIPNNVISIGLYAFKGCSNLSIVHIGNGITSIDKEAFSGCKSLTSFIIPNGVTTIEEHTFENCSGLTSCTVGSGVTSIGNYAFKNCSGLTSINIPSGVTSIGFQTFYNCSSLTSINIPSGVTSIGNYAFQSCTNLTGAIRLYSITSVNDFSFYNCSMLSSVTIGSGVTSIKNYAFKYCTSLTSITVEATTPPTLVSNALENTNSNLTIYVPSASVSTYKSASGWSNYASRIQAIP